MIGLQVDPEYPVWHAVQAEAEVQAVHVDGQLWHVLPFKYWPVGHVMALQAFPDKE